MLGDFMSQFQRAGKAVSSRDLENGRLLKKANAPHPPEKQQRKKNFCFYKLNRVMHPVSAASRPQG